MKESEGNYKSINELQMKLVYIKNSHMHGGDISNEEKDEIVKLIEKELEAEMKREVKKEKPIKISRDDYFAQMINTRDEARTRAINGEVDPHLAEAIMKIVEGNIETIHAAEMSNLKVQYYKLGEIYTYKVGTKKLGFL